MEKTRENDWFERDFLIGFQMVMYFTIPPGRSGRKAKAVRQRAF